MVRHSLRIILGCALICGSSVIVNAQEYKHLRTIPVSGIQFDIDWINNDIYTGDGQTMRRYDLVSGNLEKTWSAPAGALINDVAATNLGVYVAAAGTRKVYAYNSDGNSMVETDFNTRNRIGDVRGMLLANTGIYLVGNPGTILRIGYNPLGSPQVVGGWGVVSNNNTGWETCVVGEPPFCYSSGYSGMELGKVTGAVDLSIRENVENTGNFALFVLERRPLAGGYDYRVSILSDEGMPGLFAPHTFLFGGNVASNAGSAAYQFLEPSGIAVDAERGRVYVADQGNNRVVAFPYGGGAEYQAFGWGVDTGADKLETCTIASGCQQGLTSGQLYNPLRVQVNHTNGDVYVSTLGGINVFTSGNVPIDPTPTPLATVEPTIPGVPASSTPTPEIDSRILRAKELLTILKSTFPVAKKKLPAPPSASDSQQKKAKIKEKRKVILDARKLIKSAAAELVTLQKGAGAIVEQSIISFTEKNLADLKAAISKGTSNNEKNPSTAKKAWKQVAVLLLSLG